MTQTAKALRRHNNPFIWAFLAFVAFVSLTPTTLWIQDSEISVDNTPHGQPIEMDYDGVTVREFVGKYGVIIRDEVSHQIVCEARGGPFPYRTDSTRPEPLLMSWWAVSDQRCHGGRLPVGIYSMSTCWSIYPKIGDWVSPLPKTHCIETLEPFQIYPND